MKRNLIKAIGFFCFLPLASFSQAQSIGFKIDLKRGNTTPIVSTKLLEFESLFSIPIKTEILAFAGTTIEDGRIVGGGAWVYTFQIAGGSSGMALWGYTGPAIEFDPEGRPWKFGWVLGFRF